MGDYQFIDMSYLEDLALGSNEFKIEMLESFLNTTPESIDKMKGFISNEDWKGVGAIAHKMKTSFSFVGMENMVQLSKMIQDLGLAEERTSEIAGMVTELADTYKKAEVELKQELNRLQNS